MSRHLLILGWHSIEPTCAFPGTSPEATRRGLERQVRFLRRWTNVVPLRAALADLAAGRPLPPRAVALTFDDGYRDNVSVAAPLLTAAGLTATFFLVPGFLSGGAAVWWEDLGEAFRDTSVHELRWDGRRYDLRSPTSRSRAMDAVSDALKVLSAGEREAAVDEIRSRLRLGRSRPANPLFMDWDEAARLPELRHDIGSHTYTHPILSRENPEVQARELVRSREVLANRFQLPVDVLAFPNGLAQDYSDVTLRQVQKAGYAFAVTARTGLAGTGSPPAEIPRILINAETDLREPLRRVRFAMRGYRARWLPSRAPATGVAAARHEHRRRDPGAEWGRFGCMGPVESDESIVSEPYNLGRPASS